jgi:hypothetical protein
MGRVIPFCPCHHLREVPCLPESGRSNISQTTVGPLLIVKAAVPLQANLCLLHHLIWMLRDTWYIGLRLNFGPFELAPSPSRHLKPSRFP